MKIPMYFILFLFIFQSCKAQDLNTYGSENLKIEKVTDHLFRHISYLNTEEYGKVPCNGVIYVNNDEVVIFDTPTNDVASKELIHWVGDKNIKAVIPTHFHIDCLGGLDAFHASGIPSVANNQTIALAEKNGDAIPQEGFDHETEIKVGHETVTVRHFGEGHTKDNVIGYIPSEKAIFGGCLVKGMGAGKGNLADANIDEWPKTVIKIKGGFPELEVVIPGHGKTGGKGLLDYTIALFTEK